MYLYMDRRIKYNIFFTKKGLMQALTELCQKQL